MRPLNNSNVPGFVAKDAALGSEQYSESVAKPVMSAVDTMPKAYRELVNEFGYVDVYRAWRRGLTPQAIRAKSQNGSFKL